MNHKMVQAETMRSGQIREYLFSVNRNAHFKCQIIFNLEKCYGELTKKKEEKKTLSGARKAKAKYWNGNQPFYILRFLFKTSHEWWKEELLEFLNWNETSAEKEIVAVIPARKLPISFFAYPPNVNPNGNQSNVKNGTFAQIMRMNIQTYIPAITVPIIFCISVCTIMFIVCLIRNIWCTINRYQLNNFIIICDLCLYYVWFD